MNTRIREYRESDAEIIKKFIEKLQDFVVSTDPIKRIRRLPGFAEKAMKKVDEKIAENKGIIFVAEDEGKPVGYIFGFVCDSQSKKNLLEVVPTQVGQIEDLYVELDYRGRGVGRLLLNKMETYFKENGCDSLWLEVFASNGDARSAYTKMGFVEREVGMFKKID